MATNFQQNSLQSQASILRKISFATGLDNPTKSSKVGSMVDAVRQEISDYSGFITEKINDMRYTTATERALDVIGASEEVYRQTIQYIDLTASQKVAKVKVQDGSPFQKIKGSNSVIPAGTRFKSGSDLEIQFLDEVRLVPNEVEIYFSVRLHINPSNGGIQISKGKQILIPLDYNEYANSNEAIVIEFDEPIRFSVQNSDDDFFRARIGAKKTDPLKTQGTQLEVSIREVIGVQGVYTKRHMRGPGTVDIGFVTAQMLSSEATQNEKIAVKGAIESAIKGNYNFASSVKVLIPTEAKIIMELRTEKQNVDLGQYEDSVQKAFSAAYTYDSYNGFLISTIEDAVRNALKDETFEVVQAQVYDPAIDYVISIQSHEIIAPINIYMTLNTSNFTWVM